MPLRIVTTCQHCKRRSKEYAYGKDGRHTSDRRRCPQPIAYAGERTSYCGGRLTIVTAGRGLWLNPMKEPWEDE